jgi:predicted nucleotidyltransferase
MLYIGDTELLMPKIKEICRQKTRKENWVASIFEFYSRRLKDLGAQEIILFGSLVGGDVDVNGDLGVLVLIRSAKTGKEWQRMDGG